MKTKAKKTELEKKLEAKLEGEATVPDTARARVQPECADAAAWAGDGETGAADQEEVVLEAAEDAAPSVEDLLKAVTGERDDLNNRLLRARAEFDNYRRRMAREAERVRETAAESILRDLLPVVDNLERALSHAGDNSGGFTEGVEMVLKQMCAVLSEHGLTPIPALGEAFDPTVHEALSQQPSAEYPADAVMEDFQRGYRLGDYVLRPSKVVVSSGPPGAEAAEQADGHTATDERETAADEELSA